MARVELYPPYTKILLWACNEPNPNPYSTLTLRLQ